MDQNTQTLLERLPVPSLEEAAEQARLCPCLFPPPEQLTEDWLLLSQQYKALFSQYFLEKTGLDRLDLRIAERGFPAAAPERHTFFQKYCCLSLRYFYLRCFARVDRLCAEDLDCLQAALRSGDDGRAAAAALVERTFSMVMPVDPEQPQTVFMPLSTLWGEYAVKGCEIPLVLRSVPDLGPDRALASEQGEQDRQRILERVRTQVDPALTKDLGLPTRTAPEYFLL